MALGTLPLDSWAPPGLELSLTGKHGQVILSLRFIIYNKENNNNSNYTRHSELLRGCREMARAEHEISIGHAISSSNGSPRSHPPFVLSSLAPFLSSSPLHLHPFFHSFLLFFFFNLSEIIESLGLPGAACSRGMLNAAGVGRSRRSCFRIL